MFSVPLPTDNIYKFTCLLGVAIILAGLAATYGVYNEALSVKARLISEISQLQSEAASSPRHHDELALKNKLLDVTKNNEQMYVWIIGGAMALGVVLIAFGATRWYRIVQVRDDRIAELQLRKLELEVAAMEVGIAEGEAKKVSQGSDS
jgi:hypothetical protein